MIELAPNHKFGLSIRNPVLVAGGILGYGETLPKGFIPSSVGGIVVGPFARSGSAGAELPRVAHLPGGLIVNSGGQRVGSYSAIRRAGRSWSKLDCTLIAQIVESDVDHIGDIARRIDRVADIDGIEIAAGVRDVEHLSALIGQVARNSDRPLFAKLPLSTAAGWTESLCHTEICGIVVAQPAAGAARRADRRRPGTANGNEIVRGHYYGRTTFPLMYEQLLRVLSHQLPYSVIACGGIHTLSDAVAVLGFL